MSVRKGRSLCGIAALALFVWLGAGVCLADEPFEALAPDALVITEVMYNPAPSLEFPNGQWFELYNPGDDPVTLSGLLIGVADADQEDPYAAIQIFAPDAPVIPPHGFVVLGASKALAINGGVPVDFSYGPALVLPKGGGRLLLAMGDNILDEVAFGPFFELPAAAGISLNLEPVGMDAVSNDDPTHWCMSSQLYEPAAVQLQASPGQVGHACDSDGDGIDESGGDCNDADPQIAPGVQEKCNGVDDDCDGETDEIPLAGKPAWQYVGVCVDGGPECIEGKWKLTIPEFYEEEEVTCDYVDNDCDGETDKGLRNECDECGHVFDLCDGHDNDCDGGIDEDATAPPEGFECKGTLGVCKSIVPLCSGTEEGWICSELPREYEPEESVCDGLDNDCDGEVDEGFEVGGKCKSGYGVCRGDGLFVCSADGQGVECQTTPDTGSEELCGNDIDDDCDGQTDEGFDVGMTCSAGVGACEITGKYFCSDDGKGLECSALEMDPSDELCENNIDDDCDGVTDEPACLSAQDAVNGCGAGANGSGLLTILLVLSIPLLAAAARLARKPA